MEQIKIQTKFQRKKPLFRERPTYKCIGYARHSTNKQISIRDQVEELKRAGCVVVFQEAVSSTDKARPHFEAALGTLEEGDEIVFAKLIEGSEIKGSALTPSITFKGKGSMLEQPME